MSLGDRYELDGNCVVSVDNDDNHPVEMASMTGVDRTAPRGDRPLVLVVENEQALREVLVLTLLPIGVEVVEASDLEEARGQINDSVELIVLDFYLEPEVGTELLDDVPAGIPVLLLTASLETTELLEKHPKINAVLRKPFDQRELRSTVKTLLGIAQD